MAFTLNLSYSQSNNATTLTITDASGEYSDNSTGWGTPNPDVTDIVSASNTTHTGDETHLILSVTVTNKDGVSTTYGDINLYDHENSGDFADVSDLTWNFTPADFINDSTPMGVSTDELVDGVYSITYKLVDNDDHTTVQGSLIESILIDGDVRIDVYNKLRQLSVDYDNENNDKSREIMEALLAYSYLQSIEGSASVSMSESLITMLYTLNKLLSDGSNYTW